MKNQILMIRQEDLDGSKACGENVRPEYLEDTQANLNEARKSYNLTHNTIVLIVVSSLQKAIILNTLIAFYNIMASWVGKGTGSIKLVLKRILS